jgi:hypothetical protein
MIRKVLLPAILSLAALLAVGFFMAGGSMAQTPSPTGTAATGTVSATVTGTRPAGTTTAAATSTTAPAAPTSTPRPGIATPSNVCSQPLPQASGGQTVSLGNVTDTLPAGAGVFVWGESDLGGNNLFLVVCHASTNATVMINTNTGQEVSRLAASADGNAVLNQVVAGVRVSGTSTGGIAIIPPSTGSGGIR